MLKASRVLLVVAAILMLVAGAAHLWAHFAPPPPPVDETEEEMWRLVTEYERNLMGSPRTLMDLMKGFSLCFSLLLLFGGATNLVLMGLRPRDQGLGRALVLLSTIMISATLAISMFYFFLAPTFLLALTLLPLLAAVVVEFGARLVVAAQT
ncbi:MAG: LIC_13387 family protein [Planctomycetota bacterium]|jgi:hypothetical protein